jgi:hypothetical protein
MEREAFGAGLFINLKLGLLSLWSRGGWAVGGGGRQAA